MVCSVLPEIIDDFLLFLCVEGEAVHRAPGGQPLDESNYVGVICEICYEVSGVDWCES